MQEVETTIDLSGWGRGRPGLSFALPHLVRQRWEEIRQVFERAAPKASATAEFFEHHQELIAKETEFGKASHASIGEWSLLRDLGVFIRACRDAEAQVGNVATVGELSRVYVDAAGAI